MQYPPKVQHDFFVIFSLSRCGSTAIHRALNCHSEIRCLFEPEFQLTDSPKESFFTRLDEIRATYAGVKYTWDPSGFPFRPDHSARIDNMNRNAERWLSLQEALLMRPSQRLIFLRRRDELSRTVSDLLGQQTNIWGPRWDGDVHGDEGASYRAELAKSTVGPIDVGLVDWYLTRLPPMVRRLRQAAAVNPCLDLDYEDVFGPSRSRDPLDIYGEILDFLGYPRAAHHFDRVRVATLLGAGGKLNTADTLRRIPNYPEIEQRFGARQVPPPAVRD